MLMYYWFKLGLSTTPTLIYFLGLLLLVRLTLAKRAQVPFIAWLPYAIAAPTPVSALVHSSTLVTAGIVILFKFYSLFIRVALLKLVFYVRFTSLLISGLKRLTEADFKKVIAYSTLNQVSLILLTGALHIKYLIILHMLSHARFKFLLFLCYGVLIVQK